VTNLFRELAFNQLDELAAARSYAKLGYVAPSYKVKDIERKSFDAIAEALYARASASRESLSIGSKESWKVAFVEQCKNIRRELEVSWETNWKSLCNGKRLFVDFQSLGYLKVSSITFKRRIMQHMKGSGAPNWREMSELINSLLIGDSGA
jgi:hypothetical protein